MAALRSACICLVIAMLAACGGGSDSKETSEVAPGSVTSATLASSRSGFSYRLDIYLPASYASGTATYPVIYATDGDATTAPQGSRFLNFKEILQRRGIDAVLVGIGGTVNRNTDYLLPGAAAYHDFLTLELIPFVESRIRADPERRILSGLSFGGSFVVTSLFLEAPKTLFFSHFISAEGAFQQPSFMALEQQVSATIGTRSVPATPILARGAVGSTTNSEVVDAFYRRMVDRSFVNLALIETDFSTGHVATDNPSFEDAMARIFR